MITLSVSGENFQEIKKELEKLLSEKVKKKSKQKKEQSEQEQEEQDELPPAPKKKKKRGRPKKSKKEITLKDVKMALSKHAKAYGMDSAYEILEEHGDCDDIDDLDEDSYAAVVAGIAEYTEDED